MLAQQIPLLSHDLLCCLGYTFPNNVSVFTYNAMLPSFVFVASKIFVISRVPSRTNVSAYSHLSPALPRDIVCWNVYPGYLQQLASMSSPRRESCPLWFFTFHPLGSRCGPLSCVYAARGDAWRQTSTPHPNNGLFLCSPLLSGLIIRVVSLVNEAVICLTNSFEAPV